jgi:hypothetical protein
MEKIYQRTHDVIEQGRRAQDNIAIDTRVACPGIIQSVDYAAQTVTVQLALRERLVKDGKVEWTDIPILPDVPLFVYSGGGYCMTMPVQPGDDCLVVFGDMCIDAWWQSGGVQNQIEKRRHDLSDGFAIVGFRPQTKTVSGYSAGSAQLRNNAGTAYIEIAGDTINIHAAGGVNVDSGASVTVSSSASVTVAGGTGIGFSGPSLDIDGGGTTSIDGKHFLSHTHTGVQSGGSNTGGVS